MPLEFDESRLEDPRAGADALRGLASAAARVRSARTAAAEADLDVLALDGRPRAVVVLGAGAAAAVGDICAAALGPGCPCRWCRCAGTACRAGWAAPTSWSR